MTLGAELDQRGRELYRLDKLFIEPRQITEHVIFDSRTQARTIVEVPAIIPVVRYDSTILDIIPIDHNRIKVQRFEVDYDLSGTKIKEVKGRLWTEQELERDEINYDLCYGSNMLMFPGTGPEDYVTGKIVWTSDLPIISTVARGLDNIARSMDVRAVRNSAR